MHAGRWFAIEDCLVLSKFLVLMLHKCLQNSALYWPMCSRQLDGDDGEARALTVWKSKSLLAVDSQRNSFKRQLRRILVRPPLNEKLTHMFRSCLP